MKCSFNKWEARFDPIWTGLCLNSPHACWNSKDPYRPSMLHLAAHARITCFIVFAPHLLQPLEQCGDNLPWTLKGKTQAICWRFSLVLIINLRHYKGALNTYNLRTPANMAHTWKIKKTWKLESMHDSYMKYMISYAYHRFLMLISYVFTIRSSYC